MMKGFLFKVILFVIPVVSLVILINYFGDASNLFTNDYERKIANGILSKKNVTNISNYNDRLLQRLVIQQMDTCPDVIVLGSSRSMLINNSHFDSSTFFNNSVTGASIEDILSIYQLYIANGCHPKKVVISFDAWTLNDNNNQTRWKELSAEFNAQLLALKLPYDNSLTTSSSNHFLQLLSPSYFQGSYKQLFLHKNEPHVTELIYNENITRLKDGSITYDKKYRLADSTEVLNKAHAYINKGIYGLQNFSNLSKKKRDLFERFIDNLIEQQIEVEIFIAPYHPVVYSFIENNAKYINVMASEEYCLGLGKSRGLKVYGSFSPHVCAMSEAHFYDGMHCKESGIDLLLNAVLR